MKKTEIDYKNFKVIYRYMSTVITWSFFVILIMLAGVLFMYFIANNIYARKGSGYEPPISIYTIVSPSMVPTINVSDVIINKKVNSPAEIEVGSIITFISTSTFTNNMTITHRVKDIQVINGKYQYTTQGDNNLVPDTAPAQYEKVIGIAVFRIPKLGKIQFFVASKLGWLFVVVIPAVYVIIKDFIKLMRLKGITTEADKTNNRTIMKVESSNQNIVNHTDKEGLPKSDIAPPINFGDDPKM